MGIKDINESMEKLLEEAELQEFIAPCFAGFGYNSPFFAEYGEPEELFNDPDRVPQEILDYCVEISEPSDWDEYVEEVCTKYIEELNEALKPVLPNFNGKFVEQDSVGGPLGSRIQRCVGKVDLSKNIDDIKKYLEGHKDAFKEWVRKHHSSYDGFISFYSNNADEWNLDELDHNELGSILGFILTDAKLVDEEFDLNYKVWEDVHCYWTFDLEEVKKQFKFNVEPEYNEDLEYYVYDKDTDTYIWNKEAPGQQKLDLKVGNE